MTATILESEGMLTKYEIIYIYLYRELKKTWYTYIHIIYIANTTQESHRIEENLLPHQLTYTNGEKALTNFTYWVVRIQ